MILSWTNKIEEEAQKQLNNLEKLPFIFKHIAVMPDVHMGSGSAVGSVIATKGAVVPSAVGSDIGCGMIAVKTDMRVDYVIDNSKQIRTLIESVIPVGFNENKQFIYGDLPINFNFKNVENLSIYEPNRLKKIQNQLGTLGGGNHFIEICLDEENAVWIMLHSGSRNIGKITADYHINEAKNLMKKYFIDLPDPNLAFLAQQTKEFKKYIDDLHWCQDYAAANRIMMMNRIIKVLEINDFKIVANCHHNYTHLENHYGQNVWVTRKGAVRARKGDFGIIPGSMGTKSYIVKGKGNISSYCSCSHGAGRQMSRTQAKKKFTLEDFIKQTEGVECNKIEDLIDEIPAAYKDIDLVMEQQKDLVEIYATLKQIICIKG